MSQRPGQVMQVIKVLPCALLGSPLHPTHQTSWRGHAGEGAGVSQRPGQVMQVVKALPCALLGPPLHPTLQTSWREGGRGRPLLGPGALFAG